MFQHDNFCRFSAVLFVCGTPRVSCGVQTVQVNDVAFQSVFRRFELSFQFCLTDTLRA